MMKHEFELAKSMILELFSGAVHMMHKDGGARGVMVIVAGYGHGDTSSNPRRD